MSTDKLRAEWFWIDRWVLSAASRLPLEARGLYREMLTQAWANGAKLPGDLLDVQLMCKARPDEWLRSWPLVSQYWRTDDDGFLVNDTQLEVYAKTQSLSEARSAAGRIGNEKRWHRKPVANPIAKPVAKPDKDQSKGKDWRFSTGLYVSAKMHAFICGAVGKQAAALDWDALYNAAALDYAEHGEPPDLLNDLKRRARAAMQRTQGDNIPSAEETRRKLDVMDAIPPLTPEQRARIKEQMRGVLSPR